MGLFKPDFYRSFVIGFGLGAIAVVSVVNTQNGQPMLGNLVPSAIAATLQSVK